MTDLYGFDKINQLMGVNSCAQSDDTDEYDLWYLAKKAFEAGVCFVFIYS